MFNLIQFIFIKNKKNNKKLNKQILVCQNETLWNALL